MLKRTTFWLRLHALFIYGMLLVCPHIKADAETITQILNDNTVYIGAVDAPPWYQQDLITDEWKGLIPDIVKAIFEGSGIRIEFVPTRWDTAVAGLQSARFDLLGGFNETPQRLRAADFTDEIGKHRIGILTLSHDAAEFNTWSQFNSPNIRIAAVDGSAAALALVPALPHAQWVFVPSIDVMQLELESGRVDALVAADVQLISYVKHRQKGSVIFPAPLIEQPTHFGIRKGRPELQQWLNNRLDQLKREGVLDVLWQRHIPTFGAEEVSHV